MAKPRPITCDSDERYNGLTPYICGLAERPFEEQNPQDRGFLLEFHTHIKGCLYCPGGYRYMMLELSKDFTPQKLVLIGRNRLHLDRLIGQEGNPQTTMN